MNQPAQPSTSTRLPQLYADPETVWCPACDAEPTQPCKPHPKLYGSATTHPSRRNRPQQYDCTICGQKCHVSTVTGQLIHVATVSETHSARAQIDAG